jgi:hypothetical protein
MTLVTLGGSLPIICLWITTIVAEWLRWSGLDVWV